MLAPTIANRSAFGSVILVTGGPSRSSIIMVLLKPSMSEIADLLERFRRGAELLAVATTGAAGTELDFKPAADKWCVRQIVCHLADTEAVYVMRFRLVLAEENPVFQSFNGDAWAERLDYGRRKISHALETFRRLRTDNYELLKEMPEDAFSRPCTHAQVGPW